MNSRSSWRRWDRGAVPVRKLPILTDGVNAALLAKIRNTVADYLMDFFDAEDLVRVDDLFSFSFGSATVQVTVAPWHSEDVLVRVFAYLVEDADPAEVAPKLMRLNAETPLGAFSLAFDNTVMFSCTLPGAHLDESELLAAIQTVAVYADQYDDILKERRL